MSTEFVLDWIERKMGCAYLPKSSMPATADLGKLAKFEPLVIAASIFFDDVDAGILARLLEVDERQLTARLDVLADSGILLPTASRARARYAFADTALRQAAHKAIPDRVRLDLHRGAAEAFAGQIMGATLDNSIQAARHWQACDEPLSAVQCWRAAAQHAIAVPALLVASNCLGEALALCHTPQFNLPPHEEFLTLSAMGPLQAQLTGSGSQEVAEIYARCLEIADTYDASEASAKFDVLWGLAACILVHGRVGTAREMCDRLLRSTNVANDSRHNLLCNRLKGLGELLAGEVPVAIETLANVVRSHDDEAHASLRFHYASDQSALALAHLAWAQAIAGDLAASKQSSRRALDRAQLLNHPHTSAHVTCVLAARAQTLNLRSDAATLATGGMALARHHRYPYWQAWAEIILGWHEGGRHPGAGLARIDAAIAAYQRTGAGQVLSYAHLLRARIALAGEQRSLAIVAADQALESAAAHGVELFNAEILRVKALAQPSRDGARRLLLERALGIAQQQGTKLFEDRIVEALSGR
ncbi:MAG: hypothetical protein ABL904_17635 [Hyphomicrobiaceae bacterium]